MVMPLLVAPVDGEVAYAAAAAMGAVISWLAKLYISERNDSRAREDRLHEQNRLDAREMLTALHDNTHVLDELRSAIRERSA
ncbi:MAG: hypothetical protein HY873_13140 [Chloroflexi bacterium]|nr:hypothetical protein [Chloroflexota bacterium]